MSIEEAIKEEMVAFLRRKERLVVEVSSFEEKRYYDEIEVEIYYVDTDYDPCTFVYYGTIGDLIKEME